MAASKLDELPAWATELVESARVARLGLRDDIGHPRVLPVGFAVAEGRIWTSVDAKPKRGGRELARVRYLRHDPRAALTVDRYSDDWNELAWVQVLGTVRILDRDDARPGLEKLTEKYEPYRSSPPPGPVLALEPERCLWWRASAGSGTGPRA